MTRQSETDEDEEESQSQLPQSRIFLHQHVRQELILTVPRPLFNIARMG